MKVQEVFKSNSLEKFLKNMLTTFFITLTLACINFGSNANFLYLWMRSWGVAALISNSFTFFIFPNKYIRICRQYFN
jgi:hypothetical protein